MISDGELVISLLGLGFREVRIECFWEGDAERMRRVPSEVSCRWRKPAISLWRASPEEITTRPPPAVGSSRRSAIMCS